MGNEEATEILKTTTKQSLSLRNSEEGCIAKGFTLYCKSVSLVDMVIEGPLMLVNVPYKTFIPGLYSGASRTPSALGKPLILV